MSARVLFAYVGFWVPTAESGLLPIEAKAADFIAAGLCVCDDIR